MAGLDKIQNGLIFGALFGWLFYTYSVGLPDTNVLHYFADWIIQLKGWIIVQTWGKGLATFTYLPQTLAILLGAIVGGYIDSR